MKTAQEILGHEVDCLCGNCLTLRALIPAIREEVLLDIASDLDTLLIYSGGYVTALENKFGKEDKTYQIASGTLESVAAKYKEVIEKSFL